MIPAVDGLVVILVGLGALGGAIRVLQSLGPRFRVGRLLASAPSVSIAEALEMVQAGSRAYVRVSGRIDSETDFEDADHRPLVFRRTRFQARVGGAWTDFNVAREAVPFEVREGLDGIVVDADALHEGLVVMPRETVGVVGDLGDDAPEGMDRGLPARVVVEQVSNVEHAVIVGVPERGPDGLARLTAGLGRPLILTTLEQPEAMRVLADGSARRPRLASALLVAAAVLVVTGLVLLALPGSALAASPDPTAVVGSDTRSSGEGPGLVGAPLTAILAVVGIGIVTVVVTIAYVRLTGGPREPTTRR